MKLAARVFTLMSVFCFSLFVYGSFAYAQDVTIPEVTNDGFIQLLIASLGGMKGASALVIVGVAVKLIVAFMGTPIAGQWFKKLSGQWKITVVSLLAVVGGVVTQMSLGVSFSAALLQGASLSSILVFINQIYKQFFVKDEPALSVQNIK